MPLPTPVVPSLSRSRRTSSILCSARLVWLATFSTKTWSACFLLPTSSETNIPSLLSISGISILTLQLLRPIRFPSAQPSTECPPCLSNKISRFLKHRRKRNTSVLPGSFYGHMAALGRISSPLQAAPLYRISASKLHLPFVTANTTTFAVPKPFFNKKKQTNRAVSLINTAGLSVNRSSC